MLQKLLRLAFVILATLGLHTVVLAQAAPPAAEQAAPGAVVLSFENEAQLDALAAKGKTVVFFFASWCPNCRATVTELNARWSEVNPDLTLVIADYDKEAALKSKYGVTYQDTFVLLDSKAQGVKSWNSGGVDGLNANTAS
ncbi:TlpA family protein disulfide reductase [Paradevosia shaoguanensis]|uniref:TlpA family protein disulfide reductase n=1 Tax=Paradevosia shaoguanensis TaxID=1335043 RepID=UPI003C728239